MIRKKLLNYFIIAVFLPLALACNGNDKSATIADTTTSSGVDSMPVVKPPVRDSGSAVITPPVNDSNVVKPDTINKKY